MFCNTVLTTISDIFYIFRTHQNDIKFRLTNQRMSDKFLTNAWMNCTVPIGFRHARLITSISFTIVLLR